MILQNQDNPNSVYRMDLETGKVVDEWKVHDDININTFAPEDVSCFVPEIYKTLTFTEIRATH